MTCMTSLLTSSLLAIFVQSSGAIADPFSSELTVLGQQAVDQLRATETDLYAKCGQLSFGNDTSPANGTLAVNTQRCGQLTATADLISTYDSASGVMTWAWAQDHDEQWSTQLAQDFLARADEPGFSELSRPSLRIAGPNVAFSVSAIGVLMSDAQMLQTFSQGTEVSYVVMTFAEVPE